MARQRRMTIRELVKAGQLDGDSVFDPDLNVRTRVIASIYYGFEANLRLVTVEAIRQELSLTEDVPRYSVQSAVWGLEQDGVLVPLDSRYQRDRRYRSRASIRDAEATTYKRPRFTHRDRKPGGKRPKQKGAQLSLLNRIDDALDELDEAQRRIDRARAILKQERWEHGG